MAVGNIRKLNQPIPTTWRRGGRFAYEESIRAPYSISVNLYRYLAQRTVGSYWFDTIEISEFADWKLKLVRLDMAIDSNAFPITLDYVRSLAA